MSIAHHPADDLLVAYAAGTLDQGQRLALATHLAACPACQGWVGALEGLGGTLLSALPPSRMTGDALGLLEARAEEAVPARPAATGAMLGGDLAGLPPFVRQLAAGKWRWLAPQVQLRHLTLTEPGETRLFLLRAKPGVRLMPHDHTGSEMTCVLSGGFSHDGLHYGPGDFDWGESGVGHEIAIGEEGECVCLIAMRGKLRLKGLLGRLIQPLIAI